MYKTIVVGTDGSSTADHAVEIAAQLARTFGAELHVVSAYTAGDRGLGSPAALADTGAAGAFHREAAEQVAAKAVSSWGEALKTTTHAVSGQPNAAILDTAESVGAGLIVVGSKGMSGPRRILGSVPNSVAHNAPCDVLIVKTA